MIGDKARCRVRTTIDELQCIDQIEKTNDDKMKQDAITNLSDKINYVILSERIDEITEKLINIINSIL
jgi:hypothetical protein